jgi:hypothetical protein
MKMKLKQTITRIAEIDVEPPWAKMDHESGEPRQRPATAEEIADWLRSNFASTGQMILEALGVEVTWIEKRGPITAEPAEED